uniref:phenylalanine--tRNA ligase n=1 Tax=Culicoides sonorensis TaxID=179676 RepID=A0A336MBU6_CULSO
METQLHEQILKYLDDHEKVDTLDLAAEYNLDHQKIVGAVKSIEAHGNLINSEITSRKKWELTGEGQEVAEKGSHEATVFNAIPKEGIPQAELLKISPNSKIGMSKAVANGWIEFDKSGGAPIVKKKVDTIEDQTQKYLQTIRDSADNSSVPDNIKQEFKKRKLMQEITIKSYILSKGPEFSTKLTKLETDLTVDMLTGDLWKELSFKPYNFDALGAPPERGHLHPLMKVRSEFRQIFLEMGFIEMPTNMYVESSFWNFDALFQPQQHPARDAQDTFFLSMPEKSYKFPVDYVEKVKDIHSKGGYGSIGYRYDWKLEEAQKNLLRTHTTAVTARMLYKLAQSGQGDIPAKFFSIDKVFRNETLDATHLAEFHQVEGIVAGRGISLSNLIGILYEFFRKLNITDLEFKPAYNPYTEPSMEIFVFHPGLKKWMEIGNSGMFRPEMLRPFGIPEGVNVLGWGLSLERPTMVKYGLDNIRDLVGPKVDLKMVQANPICRLDHD